MPHLHLDGGQRFFDNDFRGDDAALRALAHLGDDLIDLIREGGEAGGVLAAGGVRVHWLTEAEERERDVGAVLLRDGHEMGGEFGSFDVVVEFAAEDGGAELVRRCGAGNVDGVELLHDAPVVREFAVRLDSPVDEAIERCAAAGIAAGYPLGRDYPEYGDGLLVALTERRSKDDIDRLAELLGGTGEAAPTEPVAEGVAT